tara:strand:- start:223 stop:375 length:153 start_codon:yes stop_codon:yes gene_type:complete
MKTDIKRNGKKISDFMIITYYFSSGKFSNYFLPRGTKIGSKLAFIQGLLI